MPGPEINPAIAAAVEQNTKPTPPASAKVIGGVITAIIGIVIAVLCGIGMSGGHGSSGGGQDAANADATQACQKFVKRDLKSPASAKFSGIGVAHVGSTYTVSGSVDSQNSFGAMLRNDFACVETRGKSDWTLVSLDGLSN